MRARRAGSRPVGAVAHAEERYRLALVHDHEQDREKDDQKGDDDLEEEDEPNREIQAVVEQRVMTHRDHLPLRK